MSELTRRAFLEVSCGALAASAVAARGAASQGTSAHAPAKLYTVLFDIAPSQDDTDLVPMTHEEPVAADDSLGG